MSNRGECDARGDGKSGQEGENSTGKVPEIKSAGSKNEIEESAVQTTKNASDVGLPTPKEASGLEPTEVTPKEEYSTSQTETGGGNLFNVLTDEQNQERIQQGKQLVRDIVEKCSLEKHKKDQFLRTSLVQLKKLYYEFRDLTPERTTRSRREIGESFIESGFVKLLCSIVKDHLTTDWLVADGQQDPDDFEGLYLAFLMLFNYSDSTPAIPVAAAAVPDFLKVIAEQLKKSFNKLASGTVFTEQDDTVTRHMLGFTNNCSSVSEVKMRLREEGYTHVLLPYLGAKVEKYKMTAILALAKMVNEEESALLYIGVDTVTFLLASLEKALETPIWRNMGLSVKELAQGVANLAANDYNKQILVAKGVLPLLLKLSFVKNEEEQREAVCALWILSFDDKIKDPMVKEPGLMDRISTLRESTYPAVRIAVQGIQWNLADKLKGKFNIYNLTGEDLIDAKGRSSSAGSIGGLASTSSQQVMLSYQWDCQQTILRIRDELRSRGYTTWMDVDNMEGSTIEAMAHAVQGSAVVLMCMSQGYKASPNCRAEAEYAFKCGISIIPLLMEDGYRPDGWLGFLLGTKLYYDFSGRHSFDTKLNKLAKALEKKGLQGNVVEDVFDEAYNNQDITPDFPDSSLKNVCKWKKEKVSEWLKERGLEKPSLSSLSGKHLTFLMNLRREAPETFYRLLEKNLRLTSIDDLTNFVEALNDLK